MTQSTQSTGGRSRCPSCGQDNACGFGADTPCWCANPMLGRIKPAPDAQACLCQNCLERALALQRDALT
jgi:hypothetical protein